MCVGFLWSRSRYLGFELSQDIIPTVNIETNCHTGDALGLAAELSSTETAIAEEVTATSGIAIGT
jgi:hypothetical protein